MLAGFNESVGNININVNFSFLKTVAIYSGLVSRGFDEPVGGTIQNVT